MWRRCSQCHPLRVESVAWVAERKDVLSGFFGLLALYFYARYTSPESSIATTMATFRASRPASTFYLLSLLFFALGLMSKPMLVTWPFVMLLLDYWPLRADFHFQLSTAQLCGDWCGENPVLCPRGGGERCDLRGAEARRRGGGG